VEWLPGETACHDVRDEPRNGADAGWTERETYHIREQDDCTHDKMSKEEAEEGALGEEVGRKGVHAWLSMQHHRDPK
jgi:hypothetical protein